MYNGIPKKSPAKSHPRPLHDDIDISDTDEGIAKDCVNNF